MMRTGLTVIGLTMIFGLAACQAPPGDPVDTGASDTAPEPGPVSPVPRRMQALGTEPFWSVAIDGEQLRYSTPEDQPGRAIVAARRDDAASSTWTGTLEGEPFELSIAPGECSDGMSDTRYRFSAALSYAGQSLSGCARLDP